MVRLFLTDQLILVIYSIFGTVFVYLLIPGNAGVQPGAYSGHEWSS